MGHSSFDPVDRPAWNMGRKLGAKRPLKPKEIWAIRFFLDQGHRLRDRALFDLAIAANCEAAISSVSVSAIWLPAGAFAPEQWSFSRRRSDLFSSSCSSRRAPASLRGLSLTMARKLSARLS